MEKIQKLIKEIADLNQNDDKFTKTCIEIAKGKEQSCKYQL